MTSMNLLSIINTVAALSIVIKGLFYVINRMGKETRWDIRLTWILVTTGALASAIAPLFGHVHPCWQEVLFMVGVALFFMAERRCFYQCARNRYLRGD